MKKWISIFIVTILFAFPLTVMANGLQTFIDIKESDWFFKDVLEMNATGVISGYDNGTFKPNSGVKKIEALAMTLRHMGVTTEPSDYDKAMFIPRVGLEVKEVPTWAQGYITNGVKMGLIQQPTGKFNFDEEANRAWVSQLLIRAIGKESDVQDLKLNPTTFSDDHKIDTQYRGYINAAVKFELINGYQADNTFRPHQITTRAEMATLLKRTNKYLKRADLSQEGIIESIKGYNLTLVSEDGSKTDLQLNPNAHIFDQKRKLSLFELAEKDKVNVVIKGKQVVFVDRLDRNVEINFKETGKVLSVTKTDQPKLIVIETKESQLLTLSYDKDTRIYIENKWKTDLDQYELRGLEVEFTYTADRELINITPKNYRVNQVVEGEIYQIDLKDKFIILKKKDGNYDSFSFSSSTLIQNLGDREVSLENLHVGDQIRVELGRNPVEKITILAIQYEGMVQSVNADNLVLTLQVGEQLEGYFVSPTAKISIEGLKLPKLSDLAAGDRVRIVVEDDKVKAINVLTRSELAEIRGKLVVLNRTEKIITIEDSKNNLIAKKYDDKVQVKLGTINYLLGDLNVGDPLVLTMNKDVVTKIELDLVKQGEIVLVDDNEITIKGSHGLETFDFARTVTVDYFTMSRPDRSDLKNGMEVQLTLNFNGEVRKVEVKEVDQYEIMSVSTTNEYIRVMDSRGKTYRVDYTKETRFVSSDRNIRTWKDLKEDDIVTLTFLGENLIEIKVD